MKHLYFNCFYIHNLTRILANIHHHCNFIYHYFVDPNVNHDCSKAYAFVFVNLTRRCCMFFANNADHCSKDLRMILTARSMFFSFTMSNMSKFHEKMLRCSFLVLI